MEKYIRPTKSHDRLSALVTFNPVLFLNCKGILNENSIKIQSVIMYHDYITYGY
jgi:hypothetical protein